MLRGAEGGGTLGVSNDEGTNPQPPLPSTTFSTFTTAGTRTLGTAMEDATSTITSAVQELVVDPDFLFQKVHGVRAAARHVTSSPWFEVVVLTAIFTNLVAMAVEDISAERAGVDSLKNLVIRRIDTVTLVMFTFEFVVKVLSVGIAPLPTWMPSFLRPDPVISPVKVNEHILQLQSTPIPGEPLLRGEGAPSTADQAPTTGLRAMLSKARGQGSNKFGSATDILASDGRRRLSMVPSHLAEVVNKVRERDAAVLLLQNMSSTKADYYFNSGWNRLDFVLLMIGYLSLLNGGGGGLSSLRALRALRPLRAFRFFAPLQSIVQSIWLSARILVNVFVCLGFFFVLFGLMGQQFFQGALQRRCVIPQGLDAARFNLSSPSFPQVWEQLKSSTAALPTNFSVYQPESWCSYESDPRSFQCGDLNVGPTLVDAYDAHGAWLGRAPVPLVCANVHHNPTAGFINFDNLGGSIYAVFVTSSLEVGAAPCATPPPHPVPSRLVLNKQLWRQQWCRCIRILRYVCKLTCVCASVQLCMCVWAWVRKRHVVRAGRTSCTCSWMQTMQPSRSFSR
jgi:hypothetical protein